MKLFGATGTSDFDELLLPGDDTAGSNDKVTCDGSGLFRIVAKTFRADCRRAMVFDGNVGVAEASPQSD